MSRYTGPKVKRERRVGVSLGLKTKPSKRIETPPGQHGRRGRRKISNYALHLTEKQKLKWTYDVSEKQMQRYYQQAARSKGNTGEKLIQLLEQRLDNMIYRLGFAPTRASARQIVSHGHVQVDEKRVNIPSYQVRPGEVITLTKKGLGIPVVQESLKETKDILPWLKRKGPVGKEEAIPTRDQVPLDINEQLIIEFYSR
ncbi:30S ribosomal protein S4 [Candidatus Microgenomates bacterium]|nr:30S ribosomal protein S4 [Candidatus Microgenomates bacterium]